LQTSFFFRARMPHLWQANRAFLPRSFGRGSGFLPLVHSV